MNSLSFLSSVCVTHLPSGACCPGCESVRLCTLRGGVQGRHRAARPGHAQGDEKSGVYHSDRESGTQHSRMPLEENTDINTLSPSLPFDLTSSVATGKTLSAFFHSIIIPQTHKVKGHLTIRKTSVVKVWSWPTENHTIVESSTYLCGLTFLHIL